MPGSAWSSPGNTPSGRNAAGCPRKTSLAMIYFCTRCSTSIASPKPDQLYRLTKTGLLFCNKTCGLAHRDENRQRLPSPPRPSVQCTECLSPARLDGHRFALWKTTGRAYCSEACSKAFRARVSSETMASTNRRFASERMKRKNPMASLEARAKMSQTLNAIRHRPSVRGGNGKPPTAPEMALLRALGVLGFEPQHVVKTRMPSGSGFPPCYKLDLGNPLFKIAIEADGACHAGVRKELDRKRDEFLAGLGWTTLRFSNEAILNSLGTVVSTTLKLMASTPIRPAA